MASSLYRVLLLCFNLYFSSVNTERLHEQIYSSIEGAAACFRRLNGTHQTGCSSADNGAVGVVQMIRNVADAQWLINNSTAGSYMAVVSSDLFYDVIELFMEQPAHVAGILLYDNSSNSATSFTQESRCPNQYSSSDLNSCSPSTSGTVWNERGTELLRRNIPFAIFFLPKSRSSEIDKIEQCYERYNSEKSDDQKGRPLCSIQLHSFMFAAVNSEICMRRSASSALLTPTKVCDPLGDYNVYYPLFPRTKLDSPAKKVTFVTARIDSASLFDGVSPGAASSVVGMVILLTAAITLSKLIPIKDAQLYDENILWTLFNGESFDYIGSQRVAYDISKGDWPSAAPLAPTDIRLHIELGQIGGSLFSSNNENVSSWPFHAFIPYDITSAEIIEFLNILSTNVDKFNITVTPEYTRNLPPSSLHSFRRILRNVTATGDLPEMLLVDHKETFTNMYYQSALDEFDKINFNYRNITIDSNGTFLSTEFLLENGTMDEYDTQVKISRFATGLAKTLYQSIVGQPYTGNISASAHLVDEMLYCFLQSQACRLIMATDYPSNSGYEEKPSEKVEPLYVGVTASASTVPIFAANLLALLTGTHLSANKTSCKDLDEPGYTYHWLRGWNHSGVCIQATVNFSAAVSPAFLIEDYDMTSGEYSSWTESVWQSMWARVFVSASGAGARLAGGLGAAATVVVALLTYWLKKQAHIVFTNTPAHSIVTDDATSGILRTVNC